VGVTGMVMLTSSMSCMSGAEAGLNQTGGQAS
jgi:hypothetical protein